MDNPAAARFCRGCGQALGAGAIASTTPVTPLMRHWRELKRDLTRNEVRRVLGEPLRIERPHAPHGAEREVWVYEYAANATGVSMLGTLQFQAHEGRLMNWVEPDWKALAAG